MAGDFLEDDLGFFFDPDHFAYPAILTLAGGEPREILVIPDEDMVRESEIGYGQYGKYYEIEVKTRDVIGVKKDDLVVVQSVTYEVVTTYDSLTGTSTLVVRRRK